MAKLLSLPAEVLSLVLGHLHDEHVSLKAVSLTGNRALTAVAQDLMRRDLRICVDFPLHKGHRFPRDFRRICNTPAQRNTVRSITFKCRSNLGNLELMSLLQKNLGKLKSVTHVHIVCSAREPHSRFDTCVTPTLLISVLRLPALHTLVVDNCSIDHAVISDSLCCRTLKVLSLNAASSQRFRHHAPDAPLPTLLRATPAVSAIEMRGTEYQYHEFVGLHSCLSCILQKIVPGPADNDHSRQPKSLKLACDCHNACCLYSNIITPLATALASFKVLEELVFKKVVEGDPLHAAQHSFLEISVAGHEFLKRLSLSFHNADYGEDTTFLCEALQRMSVLEEVTLECDGTDEAIIACIAAHPTLRCVYFEVAPPDDVHAHELAQRIAGKARQLTLIAWEAAHVMAQINEDHTVEMKVYEGPRWLQFGGDDTKWYEESRF